MSVPRPPVPPADVHGTDASPPVVRVSPLLVFGLPPFWCIVSCPACDAEGFLQEDVHPLPAAPCNRCLYGHVYRIELETPGEPHEL